MACLTDCKRFVRLSRYGYFRVTVEFKNQFCDEFYHFIWYDQSSEQVFDTIGIMLELKSKIHLCLNVSGDLQVKTTRWCGWGILCHVQLQCGSTWSWKHLKVYNVNSGSSYFGWDWVSKQWLTSSCCSKKSGSFIDLSWLPFFCGCLKCSDI